MSIEVLSHFGDTIYHEVLIDGTLQGILLTVHNSILSCRAHHQDPGA